MELAVGSLHREGQEYLNQKCSPFFSRVGVPFPLMCKCATPPMITPVDRDDLVEGLFLCPTTGFAAGCCAQGLPAPVVLSFAIVISNSLLLHGCVADT